MKTFKIYSLIFLVIVRWETTFDGSHLWSLTFNITKRHARKIDHLISRFCDVRLKPFCCLFDTRSDWWKRDGLPINKMSPIFSSNRENWKVKMLESSQVKFYNKLYFISGLPTVITYNARTKLIFLSSSHCSVFWWRLGKFYLSTIVDRPNFRRYLVSSSSKLILLSVLTTSQF